MNKENILIDKAIIHILDTSSTIPVLSDSYIEITEEIKEFIQSHISRLIDSDESKKCFFKDKSSFVYENIVGSFNPDSFILCTKNLSETLFKIMLQNVEIPSADLLFVKFRFDGNHYLGILKLNYKTSFIHYVNSMDSVVENKLITHRTILPSISQKINESIIIDSQMNIQLIEAKFEINGKKEYYLSTHFLNSTSNIAPKTVLSIATKTADNINKKYFDNDVEKKMEFKKAIDEEFTKKGEIDFGAVAERVYTNPEIKEEFKEKINTYGLLEKKVELVNDVSINKFKKQTIKTDSGIEINIPIEHYQNSDVLEFINNVNGTISILIKNIENIR